MKHNCKSSSIIANGSESFEYFNQIGKRYCQYFYRTVDGELFSVIAPTLELARKKRDSWLEEIQDRQNIVEEDNVLVRTGNGAASLF